MGNRGRARQVVRKPPVLDELIAAALACPRPEELLLPSANIKEMAEYSAYALYVDSSVEEQEGMIRGGTFHICGIPVRVIGAV